MKSENGMTETNNITSRRGVLIWVQIVIWVFLVALLALVGFRLNSIQTPMAELDKPVPDFELAFFEGYEYDGQKTMKLSDLQGKVVLINIWASWCKPCEQEAPELQEAWELYKDSDVVFIGVDYVDTPGPANEYLQKFKISYPNAPDLKSNISSILNRSMGVPETYLIDRAGILQQVKVGPFTSIDEIHAFIAAAQ
jgi:cytochrome c biogenesis protein CcmG, thiol:disulfide interchange protein DsbE